MASDGGMPSAALDFDGGLSSMATMLGAPTGGSGAAGLVDMAMGIVYPMMKPMMEASIRKITVTVKWKEGPNPVEFVLSQYITNPQSGGFMGGLFGDGGIPPTGTTGTGTQGTGTTGTGTQGTGTGTGLTPRTGAP
jgi:hypothetical protein